MSFVGKYNLKSCLRKKVFVWGVVLALMCAIAVADADRAFVLDGEITKDFEVGVLEAGVGAAVGDVKAVEEEFEIDDENIGEPVQSLTFKKDMSIRDALRFLAIRYEKNIVPSTQVDGTLGFTSLYDVTFEQAMDAILGANFRYEQDGPLTKVYTKDEYTKIKNDKERMIHKVFGLYYISAADAVALLSSVLSGSGSIYASNAAAIGVEVGDSGVKALDGGDTSALNDMVVIYDFPENIARAEKLIEQIDVRPAQVLVEATILNADLTEQNALGIDWNSLDGVSISGIGAIVGGATGAESTGFATKVATDVSAGGLAVGVTSDHLAVFIRALESVSNVTILANPKVLALNKQVGTVFIGRKDGYRDATTISQEGVAVEGSISFLETGTKLSFRPYIGDDGYIRMDIFPKDSTGEVVGGIPQETTAEVGTNIMVKDGQTIVIGGLFRDSVTTSKSQVPILGDIPVVGAAFRGTSDTVTRQEIIVMLTPHIITDPAEVRGSEREADIQRKIYNARDGLQWANQMKIAMGWYERAAKLYLDGDYESALVHVEHSLRFYPTYLEALRLREKILREVAPEELENLKRKVLEKVQNGESFRWRRN